MATSEYGHQGLQVDKQPVDYRPLAVQRFLARPHAEHAAPTHGQRGSHLGAAQQAVRQPMRQRAQRPRESLRPKRDKLRERTPGLCWIVLPGVTPAGAQQRQCNTSTVLSGPHQ